MLVTTYIASDAKLGAQELTRGWGLVASFLTRKTTRRRLSFSSRAASLNTVVNKSEPKF